jgi:hypothetical protein
LQREIKLDGVAERERELRSVRGRAMMEIDDGER